MKYVDLFSGCGGLSLGMERAGAELVLAVEKSDMAARTFYHNLVADASDPVMWKQYVSRSVRDQVKSRLLVKELSSLLEDDEVMTELAGRKLDVVVGGPPCQGFSLAGRRDSQDIRNRLPWQFLEFVERTGPRAVVIENVVGMGRRFSTEEKSSFEQLQTALADTGSGYLVQGMLVNAVHFGAPQHRPRLLIVGLRNDVAEGLGITRHTQMWASNFRDKLETSPPPLVPIPTVNAADARTVGDAISDLMIRAKPQSAPRHATYIEEMCGSKWGLKARSNGTKLNHVPRRHTDRTTDRFRLYQLFSSAAIDPRILSRITKLSALDAHLFIKTELQDLMFPAVAPDGKVLAQSLEDLVDLVMRMSTRKHSQRVLSWDAPARTVVTLPDDYVHPIEPRVFSVREMARFQGFSDDFEFLGKETTGADRRKTEVPQYSQVGNAVSPHLSWAVGRMIASLLDA